jgi:nitrogen fixation protein NifU and related proteins
MSSLEGLYQEVILDHTKRPRNFRVIEGANRKAEGYNPLCGDKVTVYLNIVDGKISDISFQGSGCAISTASASLLTETLKGKTEAEVEALFDSFQDLVTKGEVAGGDTPDLGKLEVFSGVSEFPARVKCATLSWHTLRAALAESKASEVVSTE